MRVAHAVVALAVLAAAAPPALARRPRQVPMVRVFLLAQIPAVQAELKLTDKQVAALDKMRREQAARGFPVVAPTAGPGRDPEPRPASNEPEFMRTPEWKMYRYLEESSRKAYTVLTPEQTKRMKELDVQLDGSRALLREWVVKELKLQPEQIQARNTVLATERIAYARAFPDGPAGVRPQEQQDQIEAQIRRDIDNRLWAILTTTQRKRFNELKGKPFEFPAGMKIL